MDKKLIDYQQFLQGYKTGEFAVLVNKSKAQVHYLPITTQMRKDILTQGQPLWQFAPTAIGLGTGAGAMADQQEPSS